MIKQRLELNLGTVVIGCSVQALLYAYYNKHKVIFTRRDNPTQFEVVTTGTWSLRDPLKTWEKFMFLLSFGGYMPFGDTVKHIRYVDETTLKVITQEESVIVVKFDKLYVFDDHEFLDIPVSTQLTTDRVRIADWFSVEKAENHEHVVIESKKNFMNQVIFFHNSTVERSKRKDICVVSYCSKKQIDKYPEHLVRIKTEALIKELGINPSKGQKFIKIEHELRDIHEYGRPVREDFDNVKFVYDELKFVFSVKSRRRKIDYMKYVSMKLGIA